MVKGAVEFFARKNGKHDRSEEKKIENLYKNIGELKVENDWLKK